MCVCIYTIYIIYIYIYIYIYIFIYIYIIGQYSRDKILADWDEGLFTRMGHYLCYKIKGGC